MSVEDADVDRMLVEETIVGLCVIQDDRFVHANRAFAEILGYTVPELLGLSSATHIAHVDERAKVAASIRRRLDGLVDRVNYQFRAAGKDGRTIEVEVHGATGEYRGRPAVVSSIVDVSQRETLRLQLEASEERLRVLWDKAPDMLITVDASTGRVTDCNEPTVRSLGCDKAALVGRPVLDLYHPDCRNRAREISRGFVKSRHVSDDDLRLVRADGSALDVSLSVSIFREIDGRILESILILRDISARKEVVRALAIARDGAVEAARAKSSVLATMHHEIRTPMNAVIGMTELLLDTELGSEQAGFAETIRDSGEALLHSLNDILYLAHYDAVTGLPNRVLFLDRFEQALQRARRHNELIALLYLDLDGFKQINDTMGHDAGDQVLKAVGDRFASFVRSCDTLARLGGDEFALLVTSGVSKEGVRVVADKMLGVLAKPLALTEGAASVAASVGAALYPQDGDGVQTLIKQADAAMYDAKRHGGNTYRFASPETAPVAVP